MATKIFKKKNDLIIEDYNSVTIALSKKDFLNSKNWAESLDKESKKKIDLHFSNISKFKFNDLSILNYETPFSKLLFKYIQLKRLFLNFTSSKKNNTSDRSKKIYEELAKNNFEIDFDLSPVINCRNGIPKLTSKWKLWLERSKQIKNTIDSLKNINKVLEVGCGEGCIPVSLALQFPEFFKKLNYVGFDFSYHRVLNAKTLFSKPINSINFSNTLFYNGDGKNICHEDKSFDIVYTSCVLEQIKYGKKEVLKELFRVGKYVLLNEPIIDFQNIYSKQHIKRQDYISLKISDLKKYGKIISMKKPNIHDPNYVDAFVLLKSF